MVGSSSRREVILENPTGNPLSAERERERDKRGGAGLQPEDQDQSQDGEGVEATGRVASLFSLPRELHVGSVTSPCKRDRSSGEKTTHARDMCVRIREASFVKGFPAARTCRTHMQHTHAAHTCTTHMQHTHAAYTCSTRMHHTHAAQTCTTHTMQHTCNTNIDRTHE